MADRLVRHEQLACSDGGPEILLQQQLLLHGAIGGRLEFHESPTSLGSRPLHCRAAVAQQLIPVLVVLADRRPYADRQQNAALTQHVALFTQSDGERRDGGLQEQRGLESTAVLVVLADRRPYADRQQNAALTQHVALFTQSDGERFRHGIGVSFILGDTELLDGKAETLSIRLGEKRYMLGERSILLSVC